jgi:hypothetical protein
MQAWTKKQSPFTLIGQKVRATRTLHDAPSADDDRIPRGTVGVIDDYDSSSDLFVVDFGSRYGHVLVDWPEVTLV